MEKRTKVRLMGKSFDISKGGEDVMYAAGNITVDPSGRLNRQPFKLARLATSTRRSGGRMRGLGNLTLLVKSRKALFRGRWGGTVR